MNITVPLKAGHIPKIILSLIAIELLFLGIYIIDYLSGHPYWQLCELFDLDREFTIPAWFSTIQLFMIGLIALAIRGQRNFIAPPSNAAMTVFGLGFIYLSIDEASAIHEKLTYAFYNNPYVPYFNGMHGIWIVVYGSIAILLILIFRKSIVAVWQTYRRESILFVVGMIIYLAGAGGAETITYFQIDKSNPMVYTIEVIAEEFLEMSGVTLILGSILMLAVKKLS